MSNCNHSNWQQRKKQGWDMDLYRDSEKSMFFGVCSGIAQKLDIEVNLVRLGFVIGFFILGGFTVFAYIAAVILLAKRAGGFD